MNFCALCYFLIPPVNYSCGQSGFHRMGFTTACKATGGARQLCAGKVYWEYKQATKCHFLKMHPLLLPWERKPEEGYFCE